MSWEAIGAVGEVLGAVAVLGTLVYIAIQIRRTREIAIAQAIDNSQQITLGQTNQWLDHIEVILKANSGEDLTEKESAIFFELALSRRYMAFMLYSRSKQLSQTHSYIASNFAHFLLRNPAVLKWWEEDEGLFRERGFKLNPVRGEFSYDVDGFLTTHRERDGGV